MSTPPAKNLAPVISSQQKRHSNQISDDERIAQMVWMRMQLEMSFNQVSCNPASTSDELFNN